MKLVKERNPKAKLKATSDNGPFTKEEVSKATKNISDGKAVDLDEIRQKCGK